VFLINWGEIEERLEPNYHKKEHRDLESAVLKLSKHKLRDFILYIAGGATPKTTESEKYYSDKRNGVAFVRVQNLSPAGLRLDDLKYINSETHGGMLARSQVREGDLLTKITGVGRMAVSSVAPMGFKGNINQHMVVIRTKNEETSKILAAFLNSDIGEKLASRRSTGGTRPALDYAALRSIPVILNEDIVKIMDAAYEEKREKERQAKELLDGINSYLLDELGIAMPPVEENTLENRIFFVNASKVLGSRFDPRKYTIKYQKIFNAIEDSKFDTKRLREVVSNDVSGNWGLDETEVDDGLLTCLTIRATEFDNKFNLNLENNRVKYRKYKPEIYEKVALSSNEILIEKSGGSDNQPVGRVALIEKQMVESNNLAYSNFIHKIIIKQDIAYPEYIFEYLRLMHNVKVTEVMQTQTNGIRNLIMREYFGQTVILPDKATQKRIAIEASKMRTYAKNLESIADDIVKKAKAHVEKILLEGN